MTESHTPPQGPSALFPADLVCYLRCHVDGGTLRLSTEERCGELGIVRGRLQCERCQRIYAIEGGIANMLAEELGDEDRHEIAIRDVEHTSTEPAAFVPPEFGWRSRLSDSIEIPPHLRALHPLNQKLVLELGCGDGRFTILMAQAGARVLAMDFSINALRKLAGRLPTGHAPTSYEPDLPGRGQDLRGRVGLVHADASQFRVATGCFDRALAATPLDNREQRLKMYERISAALKDDGRFIGGVEHDDLTRRLLGLPKARRYSKGGIFIEHFDSTTYRRELAPHFGRLKVQPIRPRIPFIRRLPLSWGTRISNVIATIPLVRQLGELLLVRAENPLKAPREGENRTGSRMAKWAYRWYVRKLGKPPVWGEYEPV